MNELIFLVESDIDGGYIAQALREAIFTQADDLETLKTEIKDAVNQVAHEANEGIPETKPLVVDPFAGG